MNRANSRRGQSAIAIAASLVCAFATAAQPLDCVPSPSFSCVCAGDCNQGGDVDIVDLQACINVFSGVAPLPSCRACDPMLRGGTDIVDLQSVINAFIDPVDCRPLTPARLVLGHTAAPRGGTANVVIELLAHAPDIVTVAPLNFDFDPGALDFAGCTSITEANTVVASSPEPGRVALVLYADPFADPPQPSTPLPEGPIAMCQFDVRAAAGSGESALRFVSSDVADQAFREFTAAGADGSVLIN